jgi:3-methyladenine DNA glycosylase/8-oxoguanine DNA glycosylase
MTVIDSLFVDLGRQIVAHDDIKMPVYSEEELVYRVSRLVINTQLDRLDREVRSLLVLRLPDSRHPDVWEHSLMAISRARVEVARITRIWLSRRTDEAIVVTCRTAPYNEAMRAACAELRKMDQNPEIGLLLYRGVASMRSELANACEQILVAIHVYVDLRTARRLWAARKHWEHVLGGR